MKNFVQHGDTLDMTAPAGGVISGTAYLIGALFGVATASADAGTTFPLRVVGVYTLPKATGEAWAQEGAILYWDNTNKRLTTTASGNTKVGSVASAALSAATTGVIRLNGIV
ncbi:DUF2190 family protein [Xanthobacter sp. DSM 14520]|uniref:DUF2190 family protein n=1 Tax=Xanthobacter autotrophicus (strain ATCC BAA-1158 / Py2) TaxID=78245 RepID=UPI003729CE36